MKSAVGDLGARASATWGAAAATGERTTPDPEGDAFLRAVAWAPAVDPRLLLNAPWADRTGAAFGRYQVLGCLGQGGMGVVYAAFDLVLRREVALKVLPAHLVGDPERRRRFLCEARAAAAARGPELVTVYDAGEQGSCVFISMERVVGQSLRARLDGAARWAMAGAGLGAPEVVRIGAAIARGLAAAHEAGVIHRDLKPDNVMIGERGEIKIVDFGLASLRWSRGLPGVAAVDPADGSSDDQALAGTPGYIAPEQLNSGIADERSDIFSLGVLLVELATGQRPPPGATTAEIMATLARCGITRAPRPSGRAAPPIEHLIARCLAPCPADRYSSCRALARDLASLEAALAARDERPPMRRVIWTVALAGAALAAGLACGRLDAPAPPHGLSEASASFRAEPDPGEDVVLLRIPAFRLVWGALRCNSP